MNEICSPYKSNYPSSHKNKEYVYSFLSFFSFMYDTVILHAHFIPLYTSMSCFGILIYKYLLVLLFAFYVKVKIESAARVIVV